MSSKNLTPARLALAADAYKELRDKRLALQREVDSLKEKEDVMRSELIDHLEKSKVLGIVGKLCRVELIPKKEPRVTDWDALFKHIKKTGEFELIQRRISTTAVKERWDNDDKVPGVVEDEYNDLSVRKV